jgi:hypothetical protein
MDIKRIEREIGESVKKALEGIIKGDILRMDSRIVRVIKDKAKEVGEEGLYKYISDCLLALEDVDRNLTEKRAGMYKVTTELVERWERDLLILAEEEVRKRGIKLEV